MLKLVLVHFLSWFGSLVSRIVHAHTRPTHYTKRSNSVMLTFKNKRVEPVRVPPIVVKRILDYGRHGDPTYRGRTMIGVDGVDYQLDMEPGYDEAILRLTTLGKKGIPICKTYRISRDSVHSAMA